MCLAIPGKVLRINAETSPRMGTVDFGGVQKEVCFELLPETAAGEYVIVHVGFAISILDEAEAQKTIALFQHLEHLSHDRGNTEK